MKEDDSNSEVNEPASFILFFSFPFLVAFG